MNDSLAKAREAVLAARSIVVLTGAGISAESGIPTFRDAMTGLWARFRPEDLATPKAFQRDPRSVWSWYAARRAAAAAASPNAGHRALAELEIACAARAAGFILVTQNVDGLHHASGSRRVVELHGNLRRVKCFEHGHPAATWDPDAVPPLCAVCGSMLRPDVVWFGEMLPEGALDAAMRAAATCDVLLSVGTSGLVEPAASLPFAALEAGAVVIEVNADATPLTPLATFALRGPAGAILPRLAA